MLMLYGVKNCDTVKKARQWLEARPIAYHFHDFRADGLAPELLAQWEAALGWEALLNRRGTTWRKLPGQRREGLGREQALALMLEQPSLIKRPLLQGEGKLLIGFSPEYYAAEL
jgi:arsenate reductase